MKTTLKTIAASACSILALGDFSTTQAEIYGITGQGGHSTYMKCPANTIVELLEELSMLHRQVTVIDSRTFTVGQKACNDFVADRKINGNGLFTHRWRLDQGEEA